MSAYRITQCLIFGAPSLFLAGVAVRWLHRNLRQGPQHAPVPHRDDCPCSPCQEFYDYAEIAVAIVTGCPRGLPRDGERLTQRERQALRGIEAASNRRQVRY